VRLLSLKKLKCCSEMKTNNPRYRMRRHIDLFTGLGGFTLASHANGIETVVMCEADEFRRNGLKRAWPGIPIVEDVRKFDGTKWTDAFILTAGVPCQPASRAGKQRGKEDDRWLWGEAVRIIEESRPTWIVCENPPGIQDLFEYGISLDVDGDGNAIGEVGTVVDRMGRSVFVQTLEEIEALGYEIEQIFDIPACAVNSPQLRHRLWIVAHADTLRHQKRRDFRAMATGQDAGEPGATLAEDFEGDMAIAQQMRCNAGNAGNRRKQKGAGRTHGKEPDRCCHMADTRSRSGQQRRTVFDGKMPATRTWAIDQGLSLWNSYLWTLCADGKVRRTPDDSFGLVDGLPRKLLAALGDSIVWIVAAEIMKAITIEERDHLS
jgi:site-specific DNA-cytosine methylase